MIRALILVALAVASVPASGQTWPTRAVTLIVPFAAGGGTDAFARPLAQQLDAQLGIRVLVENRAGAGGTAGAAAAARANPDGMTYASGGVGTTQHLAGELFKLLTGTKIRHVPYRGAGPAMQDLMAGQVDMAFDGLGSSAGQVLSGTIKGLAVTSPTRVPAVPDVPNAAEAGLQGFEVATWYAVFAPKGTPPEIVGRMMREIRTALASPLIRDAWARAGSDVPTLEGAAFGDYVRAEIGRWRKVVAEAGLRIE